MNAINAIAKVRFSAAKSQHVNLNKTAGLDSSLFCLQGGQTAQLPAGPWMFYALTGTAELASDAQTISIAPGHWVTADPGEAHRLVCKGEDRFVCLLVQPA